MHHLIVGKRQDKIFRIGIEQAERQFVWWRTCGARVPASGSSGVMHDAHVPLEPKAKAAFVNGCETLGHDVLSSAIVIMPGCAA